MPLSAIIFPWNNKRNMAVDTEDKISIKNLNRKLTDIFPEKEQSIRSGIFKKENIFVNLPTWLGKALNVANVFHSRPRGLSVIVTLNSKLFTFERTSNCSRPSTTSSFSIFLKHKFNALTVSFICYWFYLFNICICQQRFRHVDFIIPRENDRA